jgi:glycosyltransferase involved in cell wall biosynthesis
LPLDDPISQPELSIVIPAYNEAERVGPSLATIAAHVAHRGAAVEVLLVDDGSTDGTEAAARAAAAKLGLRFSVLRCTPNRGKGFAVRAGMRAARGRAVLFTDTDLSVPISHLERFEARLARGDADVVIGSRHAAGAQIVRHQPAARERLGTVFRDLARLLVVPDISDFTCGFKIFRRDAAQAVSVLQRLSGWGFDVEILLIARRLGLRVAEEPVEWTNDARTRVRLGRDVLRSALDLARIRWNDLRGRYRMPRAVERSAPDCS